MKIITYAQSKNDLGHLKENGVEEIILSDKRFSRLAKNEDFELLAKEARELGFKVVFEWDTLNTEDQFVPVAKEFEKINLDLIDSVRVQDPGVLEYILNNTNKPIQYITETGNHNLLGLKTWRNYIGDRLERFVISIELNKEKIQEYKNELSVDIELLGLGRILLFYSPRMLLNPLLDEDLFEDDYIEATADSEESPHKGFPVVQNRHGSFMFHLRKLSLLDKMDELKETGISHVRVDLRDMEDINLIKCINDLINGSSYEEFKSLYPFKTIRGYFHINKSDVLFKKLKNYRIQRKDESYLGEVVETRKPSYMAIQLAKTKKLSLADEVRFINPEGKEYSCKVHELKTTNNEEIKISEKGSLVLMNYMGGVWPKSQMYIKESL